MRRYTGVRVLTQTILDCDLAVYIGKDICKEAYQYRQHDNNLYLSDEEEGLISFALGMAIGTDKRIFVFCEDQYFIRNMSEFMQAGVSKCKNFVVVLFVSGGYTNVSNTPLIFDEVNSQHGILYNMGFMVHNYSNFFKQHKNPIKHIRKFWARIRGPLAVLLPVDNRKKDMPVVELSKNMTATKEFIRNKDITGYSYVPPFSIEELALGV